MSDILNSLVPVLEVALPALVVSLLAVAVVFVLTRTTKLRRCGLRATSIFISQLIVTAFLVALITYLHATIQHAEERMAVGFATMYAVVMWVVSLIIVVITVLITVARQRTQ